ncbi:related to Probable hydrolase NIT2 [Saccharomycodes ludwigii]|uniref:Related to Probable hydrolase NIT2 n=1 Tax=Saccharomycodes ludwigii TaxID=36035 RepID=A0A376B3E1_9ASCO|nr:hypothetical protein SCDLUD_000819 [Saccharomycodes ludwigii]KAH3903201.1 hypothetical protein SCDLUD_000819 [Saccharomycodes ludwigii]SSD59208.1 related to Probable hydrolase NIT2 [Saccharomycodes ludwigii]
MSCRVGVAQICSTSNIKHNLDLCFDFIGKALEKDVRVLFFPEATDYIAQSSAESKKLAKSTNAEFIIPLQEHLKKLKKEIDVSIGVHLPEINDPNDRVRNCLLYINHAGTIMSTYQKLHLFDVPGSNLYESKTVVPGMKAPIPIKTPIGMLGPSICYDIRFPEQGLYLRSKGSDIITYPSAFTVKTGEAHWEILGRCRAIETQCYVLMPGQYGKHNGKRESYGHSMIIDPWGTVIAEAVKNEDELLVAEIDHYKLAEIRKNMPLLEQARHDIFDSVS